MQHAHTSLLAAQELAYMSRQIRESLCTHCAQICCASAASPEAALKILWLWKLLCKVDKAIVQTICGRWCSSWPALQLEVLVAVVTGRLLVARKLPAQQLLGRKGMGWVRTAQQPPAGQKEQRQRAAQPLPVQAQGSVQLCRAPEQVGHHYAPGASVLSGMAGTQAAARARAPMRKRPHAR